METIYVDKHTALERHNSTLRIRHHSEHMQILTTLERTGIQGIVELKPQHRTSPSVARAIAIQTVDEEFVLIPVWSDEDVEVMYKCLTDFWRE